MKKLFDMQISDYKAHYKEYLGCCFVPVVDTILSSMKASWKNKLWLLFLNDSKYGNPTDITGGQGRWKKFHRNKNKQTKLKIMIQENYGGSRMSETNYQLCLDFWC